ncbi:MAG: hypothetical protein KIH01_01790 [Candidatus Freyarchaeota archaeon]|nr:hypothetical protein [Candidatus Jordarchaeia archaeon]
MSGSLLLTEACRFRLEPNEEQRIILEELFSAYEDMVRGCLSRALSMNITSRKRLHEAVYHGLRAKYPIILHIISIRL